MHRMEMTPLLCRPRGPATLILPPRPCRPRNRRRHQNGPHRRNGRRRLKRVLLIRSPVGHPHQERRVRKRTIHLGSPPPPSVAMATVTASRISRRLSRSVLTGTWSKFSKMLRSRGYSPFFLNFWKDFFLYWNLMFLLFSGGGGNVRCEVFYETMTSAEPK